MVENDEAAAITYMMEEAELLADEEKEEEKAKSTINGKSAVKGKDLKDVSLLYYAALQVQSDKLPSVSLPSVSPLELFAPLSSHEALISVGGYDTYTGYACSSDATRSSDVVRAGLLCRPCRMSHLQTEGETRADLALRQQKGHEQVCEIVLPRSNGGGQD